MKPTLVILAAGMASRYGSMKQTEGFGPQGETIMDYSIYDAIKAGFGKVVFIIREDFAENFKAAFEPKLKGKINTEYVYQKLSSFVEGELPAERTKPWGTAHAVLCAKDAVSEPFAVINADDFYGTDAFKKAADFLTNQCNEKTWCIIGYELPKTLSEFGTVSRGVCKVDADGNLNNITEYTKLALEGDEIVNNGEDGRTVVPSNTKVSMNFWGFHPNVFPMSLELFRSFFNAEKNNLKSEFFIPIVATHFMDNDGSIKVIPTNSDWFGVTYKEDAPDVKRKLDVLIESGAYPSNLWG